MRSPVEHLQLEEVERFGRGDLEAAAAEAERARLPRYRGSGMAERIFLEHVLADDAELAHAVGDEGRNVVVAHEHQVEREILGARGQLRSCRSARRRPRVA